MARPTKRVVRKAPPGAVRAGPLPPRRMATGGPIMPQINPGPGRMQRPMAPAPMAPPMARPPMRRFKDGGSVKLPAQMTEFGPGGRKRPISSATVMQDARESSRKPPSRPRGRR